ncbi:MAG: LytTR family DNA-binding domain-containing protein [Bacteroidota bacterium]
MAQPDHIPVLIVDDEQPARTLLTRFVRDRAELKLVAACKSIVEAERLLEAEEVGLMLLDIQMPMRTGIEFLRETPQRPPVILTTAYPDYALEGYALDVIDYLLKPISPVRFTRAIDKALAHLDINQKAASFDSLQPQQPRTHRIKTGYDVYQLDLQEIRYISGESDYVQYHTPDKRYLELNTLRDLEQQLPSSHFQRIHRSYIIGRKHIKGRRGHFLVLQDGTELPIGKTYRKRISTEW